MRNVTQANPIWRRWLMAPVFLLLLLLTACGAAATPVVVEKEVIKEVPKEVVVEKEVIKEVVVEKEVVKEVLVVPKRGGTIKVVPQGSIKSLDPGWTTAIVTRTTANHLFETLFALDEDLTPQPQMVDTWEVSSDSLMYKFKLRDGLTFHDGRPVTTADVLASIDRWANRDSFGRTLLKFIDKIEAQGDLEFTINLKETTGLLLAGLAKPGGFLPVIMPADQAAIPATEGIKGALIGSGAFKFGSWEPGNKLVLERFDGYSSRPEPRSGLHGARDAFVDEFVQIEIPDHATRVAALETGEVHVLDEFRADFAERIKSNPDLTLHIIKPGNALVLIPNNSRPPFNDVRARRALLLAYPNEKALRAGAGAPEFWFLCPGMMRCLTRWETDVGKENYNLQDLEAGRMLVQEAGLVGTTVRLPSPEDFPVLPDASLVTREVLEALGFKVEFQATDWATVVTKRAQPDQWEAFHTWSSFGGGGWNPMVLQMAAHQGWFNKYESLEMDELRKQFAGSPTYEEQFEIVKKMQLLFYKDVPYVSIGQFFPVMATRKEVKGFEPNPLVLRMWGVWLEP